MASASAVGIGISPRTTLRADVLTLPIRTGTARRAIAGRSVDREEAMRAFAAEPWFAELRYVGTDARYHVFERPDAEAARLDGQRETIRASLGRLAEVAAESA